MTKYAIADKRRNELPRHEKSQLSRVTNDAQCKPGFANHLLSPESPRPLQDRLQSRFQSRLQSRIQSRIRSRQQHRKQKGMSLIEAVVGLCVLLPLVLFAVDVAVVTVIAQMNEEFAEQLARLCSTVQNQANATKACQDVISRYENPANVKSVELVSVKFDVGLQQVSVTTSMVVNLPVPMFGQNTYTLSASAMQPIVSFPAPQ